MVRRYRRIRLKDTSKRSLVIRADKRERFLVYSYIRGEFIPSPDKDLRKMKLKIKDIDTSNCFDKAMIGLLSKVNWFRLASVENKDEAVNYIYENSPSKKYMRILRKSNKLKTKKGILYFYTPLVFFAWLTAPSTTYDSSRRTVSFKVNRKEELEDVRDWFYFGNLEEVTGDRESHYEINVTIDRENCQVIADEDNIMKMILYISKDKYVHKYFSDLVDMIRKELCVSGTEESWNELGEQCRGNSDEWSRKNSRIEAKCARQVLRRSNRKQKSLGGENSKGPRNKGKAEYKVYSDSKRRHQSPSGRRAS